MPAGSRPGAGDDASPLTISNPTQDTGPSLLMANSSEQSRPLCVTYSTTIMKTALLVPYSRVVQRKVEDHEKAETRSLSLGFPERSTVQAISA